MLTYFYGLFILFLLGRGVGDEAVLVFYEILDIFRSGFAMF